MLAAAGPAAAGTFSIAPVRVELQGSQRTAVLTVHNDDAAPLVVQVSALNWTQAGGEDGNSPTRELLATPPVFTLPPNGEQIVRVALRREPDPSRELDYRLLLAEVPQPADRNFTGLRVALRLSIPVFVQAANPAPAALRWHAQWLPDGGLAVSASNEGLTHQQVSDFTLHFAGSEAVARGVVSRYVLPGSTVTWKIAPPAGVAHDAAISIRGASDQGDFQADVAFADR
ncbi:MAG TPA: molecular chaperone [Steroidobacteraceae bacterium]|nr:molecular chaperone [Steroidobacteraceae bacterium]